MNIPNSTSTNSVGGGGDNVPRIRNLHPSQFSPDHPYGSIQSHDEHIPIERTMSSISERIGDFVGSYSRTSMMFMAENLAVPNGPLVKFCFDQYLLFFFWHVFLTNVNNRTKRINTRPFHQDLLQESLQNNLYPASKQDPAAVV
jgi:hypothetical protein